MKRIALAVTLAILRSTPVSAQHIAFYGVTVVDVAEGTVRPSHTVVVKDGKIVQIAPSIITPVPRGAQRIDAFRHFLIPGLIETNGVLATSGDDVDADEVLDIYKSHGVTTLRAPLTDRKQEDLRRRSERGDKEHPRVLLGPPPRAGQEMSIKGLWRSGTLIPSRPAGLVPSVTLRALTIDAAKQLGLEDAGVIRVGARADLVLLASDPLESTDALNRIDGVMTFGRWEAVRATTAEWEDRAADALYGYRVTLPTAGFERTSCHGESMQDCFGGDPSCNLRTNCLASSLPDMRTALLDELDRYGATAWRSGWLVGQRVKFAMISGDADRALAAANSCGASLWWCQALRGYVLQRSSRDGSAQLDSAFANTTPLTPAEVRLTNQRGPPPRANIKCVWPDLRPLLTFRMFEEYDDEKSICVEIPFERRFWWLSDPLWSVPGNERKAEHYARRVEGSIGLSGPLPEEAHLAWGAPNSWEPAVVPPVRGSIRDTPAMVPDFFVNGGYGFSPDDDRFYEPGKSTSDDWALELNKGRKVKPLVREINPQDPNPPIFVHQPDERMLTAERWYGMVNQLAMLRRGDKLLAMNVGALPLAIAAADVTAAALAMGRPSDLRIESASARVDPLGRVRAMVEVPVPIPFEVATRLVELTPDRQPLYAPSDLEWMASLEVIAPGLRARARESAPQPLLTDGFGVSDIVLVRDDFETSRAPLLDAMLPSTTLSKIQPIGIYFEVYGVSAGERLQFAVATAPTNLSLAQRLAGALRMRSEDGLDVSWLEAAETPTPGTMTRFVKLELANLADGPHEILVTVTRADGTVASASRLVRVGP